MVSSRFMDTIGVASVYIYIYICNVFGQAGV